MNKNVDGKSRPWIKVVKERYIERSFRDNEPIIRDETDEWMIQLNDVAAGVSDVEAIRTYEQ